MIMYMKSCKFVNYNLIGGKGGVKSPFSCFNSKTYFQVMPKVPRYKSYMGLMYGIYITRILKKTCAAYPTFSLNWLWIPRKSLISLNCKEKNPKQNANHIKIYTFKLFFFSRFQIFNRILNKFLSFFLHSFFHHMFVLMIVWMCFSSTNDDRINRKELFKGTTLLFYSEICK